MSFLKNTGDKLLNGSKYAVSKSKTTGSSFLQKSVTGGSKVFHGFADIMEKVNPIPAKRREEEQQPDSEEEKVGQPQDYEYAQ